MTLISGYMLGSLWCYAAIFAAALEANLAPSGHVLYVGLFAVFVVPLSLKDLADQKAVQTLLAFGRVVMLAVMLVTALTYLGSMGPIAPMPKRTGTFDGGAALAPPPPMIFLSRMIHFQLFLHIIIKNLIDKQITKTLLCRE